MKPEDGPMFPHMVEMWQKLLEVTRQRDQLLAAIALHKLVVNQAGDDGEVQAAADMRLWSDAIGVIEADL